MNEFCGKRPKRQNVDLGLGTSNIWCCYRVASLMKISRKLFGYKLHLMQNGMRTMNFYIRDHVSN
jgi:hypothetical protein